MSSLDFRLQLLKDSETISPEVAGLTRRLMARVEAEYGLTLTEENGSMFVTHLAVALERLRAGEAIEQMPPEALAEVRGHAREWAFMQQAAGEAASQLGVSVPEGEVGFLTAHLAALVHGEAAGAGESGADSGDLGR